MELQLPISEIKGIGEKTELLYHKLNIFTLEDLLEHYPRNYDSYEEILPIGEVREGEMVTIEASLVAVPQLKKIRGLNILNCRVRDFSGDLMLTWFNMPFLKKTLHLGTKYLFRGRVSRKNQQYTMAQPQILSKAEYVNRLHELQPIYSLTKGLNNNTIVKAVKAILKEAVFETDYLTPTIRKKYKLVTYKEAIREIHFPSNHESMLKARRRIVFDEFFLFTLALHQMKKERSKKASRFVWEKTTKCQELISKLPYELTNAQKKVWDEMETDMASNHVMNRLIQGDVGSGKTVLAALALLKAAKNQVQGALMVPTEVLAQQHYETLRELLEPFGVKLCLLVGSMSAKEKRQCYQLIQMHEVDVIIGTHALIQEKAEYNNLGLVITDEQHRFGVKQREALSNKGLEPHIIVMSATPIPRTLAIILYGDLDLSIIDELPAKRLPIKNCVVNTNYRATAYHFMEKEIAKGRQIYIICPMVEESEELEVENVIDYTEKVKSSVAPSIVVEYLHGKMKASEKNDIMGRFASGDIQIMISTTVVEVGVNVPNASVMMVENAERFGLAQLHQLRGRVGRGEHQSFCILVHGSESKQTMERLEILNQSNDGFFIAREDLRLRGPGDFFGIRQSGLLEFKMADVFNDANILMEANEAAMEWKANEVKQMLKKHENLRRKIIRYGGTIFL
ncbi:MAG: ATP-dependent DNA helicase RecG [Velocimicrobium sp.]